MQGRIVDHHRDIIDAIERQDNVALVEKLTLHAVFFHESIISSLGGTRGFTAPVADIRQNLTVV
jgi:DNA-binding GntR family transcriptional regulator